MDILRRLFIAIATLAAFAGASGPAAAAESYDGCFGFIDALPATITTQGTWCLRQNLDTSATSGPMIDIQTNNVTIDCNGFRMRGSGGGPSTAAFGIFASGRLNITIRHCTIGGFLVGIALNDGSDYLVENNLIDQSRFIGIKPAGSGVAVLDNVIGQSSLSTGTGVSCANNTTHVRDNVILHYGTGIAVTCDDAGGNSVN